jgi:hypothetical protein
VDYDDTSRLIQEQLPLITRIAERADESLGTKLRTDSGSYGWRYQEDDEEFGDDILTFRPRGLSRSLTDGLLRRSSSAETWIAQIPKLTVSCSFCTRTSTRAMSW